MSCTCCVCGALRANPSDPRYIGMACREAIKPPCLFCGGTRSDGIVAHAWNCEWCTLLQHVADLTARLAFVEKRLGLTYIPPPKESNGSSEAIPDTQRSGARVYCGPGEPEFIGSTPPGAPELHPDSRPTEPSGAPDPCADPAPRGPAGAEPGS